MFSILTIILSKGKIKRSFKIFEKIEELIIRMTQIEAVIDSDN